MPAPLPLETDYALPARADVVVVGGGIVGASTALELAERGLAVALCEKGTIGAEQSGRNWGWCRQMGRDAREIPLIVESLKIWRTLNTRVGAETGFRQAGIVYLSATEAELAARLRWFEANARPYGLNVEPITPGEAQALMPGSTVRWKGGLVSPEDGRAEPHMAVAAIAAAARRHGARILAPCAVRGLDTAAGRIAGVVTERGSIACDAVVVAAGAWSRLFLGNHRIRFPQLAVVNSVMRTAPIETGLERAASGAKFAIRRRLDGGYTISHRHLSVADIVPDSFSLLFTFLPVLLVDRKGLRLRFGDRFFEALRQKRRWAMDEVSPFEEMRVLDPAPVDPILDEAAESLKRTFPAFASMEIVERWAGAIDATPDAVPVISPVDRHPGLYLASGFSGHGFGLGPGAGRLMADLVTGKPPVADPRPYRYSRFFDGTPPRPTTGL